MAFGLNASGRQRSGGSEDPPLRASLATSDELEFAEVKDLYAALGVPNFASADEIRTAYRRLASSLHPDRAGDRSTSAFQDIAAAYEVLGDPDRRAKYDA